MENDKEKEMKEMLDKMSEKYRGKETFLSELRKNNPDNIYLMILDFLFQGLQDGVQGKPEWQSENDLRQSNNRYAGGMYNGGHYRDNSVNDSLIRGIDMARRMTGIGQFYRSYARENSTEQEEYLCKVKERLGEIIGQSLSESDIKCLICREAGNLINKICKDESFDAVKEFTELCMAMKGYTQMLPEELEMQAKEEAISKYAEMLEYSEGNRRAFRSRVMDDGDYAGRRRMEGRDFRDHRGMLPTVEIAEFGRRGRDSMGRFK